MKKIRIFITGLMLLGSFGLRAAPVFAATSQQTVCEGIGLVESGGNCQTVGENPSVESLIRTIISILSYVIGAIAIIMVIIGSFKYVTSRGDSNAVKSAKDTILYALIGVVIAVLAQLLVRFVITQATSNPPAPTGPGADTCIPGGPCSP